MEKRTKVGVIGCGKISGIYLEAAKMFPFIEIAACADIVKERAEEKALEHSIQKACSVDEILADDEIDIILNLTIPIAHKGVASAALDACKSVYNEKPLTITREEGQTLLLKAAEKGLLVGCAPDTFMGAGIQTCRKIIDDGVIGRPVGATAFMMSSGPEDWHPDPEFYYKVGGGPMFDMGPYYLTALVNLLGPVRRVTGATSISRPERTITSEPKYGQQITVDVPTHVAGLLDFESGVVGTIITSFDVWAAKLPTIEIYGTEGSLAVPDPNGFGGPVLLRLAGDKEWRETPLTHGYAGQGRSIGVADMARALQLGRPHRASGELAYHVLDIMHAIHDASDSGAHVMLSSTCARPAALPVGLRDGEL